MPIIDVKKALECSTARGAECQEETETIIGVNALSLWYGKKQALNEISLEIKKNRVTAIIGPSGCGKSTLIKTFNRMTDLVHGVRTEGAINFEGTNLLADGIDLVELRKRIGMVFQKPNPFPMSIYDNVAYGPRVHGISDKKKLDEIVERSLRHSALWDEVKDRLDESGLALSGGQQQRLCIARCLAVDPEIILMDEPCSALDPIATSKIEDLIATLKKDYTIIIVTHNMQQAARVSDFTAFLYMGKLIETGRTMEMFENPKNKETENYLTGRMG
jgi:phosphate transport system ATP-binding protein